MNIKSGTLFIIDPDGTEHELGATIEEPADLIPDESNLTYPADFGIPIKEVTFTTHVTKEQHLRMLDVFTGLFKAICEVCPNKRVIYLAMYAKKRKTRKKNRNRAIRILEKEAQTC